MSILERIKNLLEPQLEDFNFRVDSTGWEIRAIGLHVYLENPEKDIWECRDGFVGEQLFTWNAAMRETKKAEKRMPTKEEFKALVKTREDIKNLILVGYGGEHNFYGRTSNALFWSSTCAYTMKSWYAILQKKHNLMLTGIHNQKYVLSVRCIK